MTMSIGLMLVDDSREYLESIRDCSRYRALGWKIIQALKPGEALTEILKSVPEVLVLDFSFGRDYPEAGLEVARGLLKQKLSRPITIVVNSADLPREAEQAFRGIPTEAEVTFIFLLQKALVSDLEEIQKRVG